MVIIGVLCGGMSYLFKTLMNLVTTYNKDVRDLTTSFQNDVKAIAKESNDTSKQISDQFIALHKDTLQRIGNNERTKDS